MSDRALYQRLLLDHNRNPRRRGRLTDPTHQAERANPLCGDRLHLTLRIVDGAIADAACETTGCAISRAAASILVDRLPGATTGEALEFADRVERFCRGEPPTASCCPPADPDEALSALAGVRDYPMRIRCALLACEALRHALSTRPGPAPSQKFPP